MLLEEKSNFDTHNYVEKTDTKANLKLRKCDTQLPFSEHATALSTKRSLRGRSGVLTAL